MGLVPASVRPIEARTVAQALLHAMLEVAPGVQLLSSARLQQLWISSARRRATVAPGSVRDRMQISFLGAADAVTGSRHLVDAGGTAHPARLRAVPGLQDAARAQLGAVSGRPGIDRRRRAEPRAPGPLRLPAGAGEAGFQGHGVCVAGDAGTRRGDAARQRPPAGRGRPARQPAAAARAMRRRCRCTPWPTPSARWRASCRSRRAAARRVGTVRVSLSPVGHLLGACAVTLQAGGTALVFSGDLGRSNDLLMPRAAAHRRAPTCCSSSRPTATGCTRTRTRRPRLGAIIRATVRRGGSVLLPSFAVGRAQALLLVLQRLSDAGEIPADLPVFLDSPMATQATDALPAPRASCCASGRARRPRCATA